MDEDQPENNNQNNMNEEDINNNEDNNQNPENEENNEINDQEANIQNEDQENNENVNENQTEQNEDENYDQEDMGENEGEINNQEENREPTEEEKKDDDSLISYDENEDFPEFANKENTKLNDIIKGYKKGLKDLNKDIESDTEMIKILKVHTQSVENQVSKREKMLKEMTESVDNQNHTIEVVKRQIGKVKSQRKQLENQELSLQERFNTLQQNIAFANEKMDSYKLNMKNILEELEQWALAARLKEEDKLSIEKHFRHDELRVKDIMLKIEKLTLEVNSRMHDLEREVTETQASQIQMEKTTEELRKLQEERQDLIDQYYHTQEIIKTLSEELKKKCDEYYFNKEKLGGMKDELDKNIKDYQDKIKANKYSEEVIKTKENELSKARTEKYNFEIEHNEIQNDIEIKKNELSALARELTSKTNNTNYTKNELEKKRKNLDEAKSMYNNKNREIAENEIKCKDASENEKYYLKENSDLKNAKKEKKAELDKQVTSLYEKSKELFKQREIEANTIGNINNVISAKKNLKANISKLRNEINKQGELIYNVDFQIQLMERKVDWVMGKRTQEETKEINKTTEMLEKQVNDLINENDKIEKSIGMIREDLRKVEMNLKSEQKDDQEKTSKIEELELENMKCLEDLNKKRKQKEEILVEHDLMKLDIKKIYDRLIDEANNVFSNENKLAQLELSIKEREKQINVHKDILIAEHKSAEEERHKAATELSLKSTRAKNLKLKYESLIQKTKGDGNEEKYSQAYYVIKTAQEKEELQRQYDEMQGKIAKCRKDYLSLHKTLVSLNERNDKLKKALILKKKGEVDQSKIESLSKKYEQESKEMWKKKGIKVIKKKD